MSLATKKLNIWKGIIITLALLCVCLSLLNCRKGESADWLVHDGAVTSVTHARNNFSVFACVLAVVHILLVWRNHFGLQLIPAVLSSANIVLPPMVSKLHDYLNDIIVYIRAPEVKSTASSWEPTPVGYVYIAAGWLLLIMSVVAAWVVKRNMITAQNQDAEERNEAIK